MTLHPDPESAMPLFSRTEPALPLRGIHLDLKGLPPTPERLLELLGLLAACRINLVLLEWEDAFPWRIEALRSPTAYPEEAVAAVLARAQELGIEVVPLVQTFGHLQNVLRLERFAELRERAGSWEDCCPSHPATQPLLRELIDEVIDRHPGSVRIHLGGDEVRSLGSCPRCRERVAAQGRDGLYLAHVRPLLAQVAARGLRPILWDDMLRGWSPSSLRRIGAEADLMAWSYDADPWTFLPRAQLDAFASAGVPLWAASAFRGADGATADHPALAVRAANLAAWAQAAAVRGLRGAVATGWARYTTVLAPCESLESALDSLVLAAASMWDGELGPDAAREAETLLVEGRLARWGGEPFRVRRGAARDLAAWRAERWPLEHLLSHAALAGETGRLDPVAFAEARHGLATHLARGEQLAAAWVAAHRGAVDRPWLERYAESRLAFGRSLLKPLLEQAQAALDQV